MWMLWAFWIEVLLFAAYLVWQLLASPSGKPLRWFQIANLIVYGAALVYGLIEFTKFVRRRIAARAG